MKIGTIIKEVRSNKGISQGKLANACQISQAYLSQIENEVKIPSNKTLVLLSEELGVPLSALSYLAIEMKDVPESKKLAYEQLSPTIESLIKSVFL